jgi:cyclo(L-leucyl-L-leucyl) synthase
MRPHAVIGISPFNSRFSTDYIDRLIGWAGKRFAAIDVLHPGEESALLLMGTGTAEGKARRKARQQATRNLRDVEAALTRHGLALARGAMSTFANFVDLERYQLLYRSTIDEYNRNPVFQQACREMTTQAVAGRRAAVIDPSRQSSIAAIIPAPI